MKDFNYQINVTITAPSREFADTAFKARFGFEPMDVHFVGTVEDLGEIGQ